VFAGEGDAGFEQEGGEIAAAEAGGYLFTEVIEGGGEAVAGACFFVPQGAEDNGVGRQGDRIGREGDVPEDLEGAIGPGVEVWLDAAFESEQATGKPVCAGGDRQVMAEVVVPEGGVVKGNGGGWHRHQMC